MRSRYEAADPQMLVVEAIRRHKRRDQLCAAILGPLGQFVTATVGCCTVAALPVTRIDPMAYIEFRFGSGPGIRTLNLAVNRSLRPAQKWHREFAESC